MAAVHQHRLLSTSHSPAKARPQPHLLQAAQPRSTHTQTQAPLSDRNPSTTSPKPRTRPSRRLAPGLEERLRKLEEQKRQKEAEAHRKHSIGRIPEQQLEVLERLQHERAVTEVQRRGKAWSGVPLRVMPSGGVRLSGGPVLTDNELSVLESDVSSVIDISDHFVGSETEDDRDELHDPHKYRLPDVGKTRLNLHTKEPLSPGPRRAPMSPQKLSQNSKPNPSTPRTPHTAANGDSPAAKMEFPPNWHTRNSSVDNMSDSDFGGPSLSRAGSIYTLGRASFAGQLAQLTSMRLPDADSLAKRILSIPTALEAARALTDASEQIRVWIGKASDVLDGLNAEDDVEWAAAGGREGIEDVDQAINRFQKLVEIYVEAIERLQTRKDITHLSAEEIRGSVGQMESIISSWKKIKDTLRNVKFQVEIAMDWEEIWNSVLGEVAMEMDGLSRLVFEMEEKRHQGGEALLSSKDSIDLSELETIVEEQPGRGKSGRGGRIAMQPFALSLPVQPPQLSAPDGKEDSSLLALFARMQPLRAALDFLPMRLSTWRIRGNPIFPSAYIDLEQRRDQLEAQWKKLEVDADSLRRELGEDRWVMVFRNAGRQALKMTESINRSFSKLKEGLDANEQQKNLASLSTKIENYEQKKRHYGPAIQRVLTIIDRGVMDRLTVNGEILRLQSDMKRRWTSLQSEMAEMDSLIDSIEQDRRECLRDSVSTVISSERSINSSIADTPGSSPASSVLGGSRRDSLGSKTPTPLMNIKTRSSRSNSRTRRSSNNSFSARKSILPKSSFTERMSSVGSPNSSLPTPTKQPTWPSRPEPHLGNKPRWVNMAKAKSNDFRPLSAFEPSPYAKGPATPKSSYLRVPSGTPGLRITSAPTPQHPTSIPRATSLATSLRQSSLPVPSGTPSKAGPSLQSKASAPGSLRPSSRLAGGRRSTLLPPLPTDGNEADNESPSHHKRPPSAMASGRRSSMLPNRPASRLDGKAVDVQYPKPRWRP